MAKINKPPFIFPGVLLRLCASAFCFFGLCAAQMEGRQLEEEEILQIDSGTADYHGKIITLTGEVVVVHELGTIAANRVVVYPSDDEKKYRLGRLIMDGKVQISTKDGGTLDCAKAEMDYQTMVGAFSGNSADDFVTYAESSKDRRNNKIPIVLKSRRMTMALIREDAREGVAAKCVINTVQADEDVSVEYNENYIAAADAGVYQRKFDSSLNQPSFSLPGLITLKKGEKGICQVTDRNQDRIEADAICIDTNKRSISFENPRGEIYAAPGAGKDPERVALTADALVWDDARDLLSLQKNVRITQRGFGNIAAENQIDLFHVVKNGKKQLKAIESKGVTTITRTEEDKDLCHTLVCHGKLFIDHEKLEMIMESPLDENKKVAEGKQIYFSDEMGEIWADKLKVVYSLSDHSLVPVKLILVGHVRIIDRKPAGPEGVSSALHYALADVLEYETKSKEMLFKAFKKRRVLFYDKVNNLQVSAPALKIKRNESSKKEAVEGIGDVRLSFVEHEFEQLRKHFSLELEQKKE